MLVRQHMCDKRDTLPLRNMVERGCFRNSESSVYGDSCTETAVQMMSYEIGKVE